MVDGGQKDNPMSNINPGEEWRSGFRVGIWDKYSRWMYPGRPEYADERMPTVGEILQPLADNVDAIPIHSLYRPDEVNNIMEPVVCVATLAGENPRFRGDATMLLSMPNVYGPWDPENSAENYWTNSANGREAAALKKIYGGLAGTGKQMADPREIVQFVKHATHAVGTTPVLTELGRESGLLQAALVAADHLQGRTDMLDAVDRKFFILNSEILEGIDADPIEFHKKLNDEIFTSNSRRGYPARTLLEARGLL